MKTSLKTFNQPTPLWQTFFTIEMLDTFHLAAVFVCDPGFPAGNLKLRPMYAIRGVLYNLVCLLYMYLYKISSQKLLTCVFQNEMIYI